ncbi:thiolase family protein [Thermodesulfobacteriota bacterium]
MITGEEVVITTALRTPIGSFGGAFRDLRAPDLAVPLIKEIVASSGIDPAVVDDVIMGCAYQRVQNESNIARVAAVKAGLPVTVPGVTIQRVCTSAMWAIVSGAQAIRLGDAQVILAGGVESMSTVPYTVDAMRYGTRLGHAEINDALRDGLDRCGIGPSMGMTAENLSDQYNITREEQDELALTSHMRAVKAIKEGQFKDEILPISVPQRKGDPLMVDTDQGPREDTSMERLAKLAPIFKKGGTVTAGNASSMNDGAAGMLMMSRSKAEELGMTPIARIISYGLAGVDPDIMGIGPVPASKQALERAGLELKDIELFEINEAFAAQYLAVEKELGLNREITNVNGSGISLGHPVGVTGCRIVVTLLYEMAKRGNQFGLASLCGGGGVGMALIVERL